PGLAHEAERLAPMDRDRDTRHRLHRAELALDDRTRRDRELLDEVVDLEDHLALARRRAVAGLVLGLEEADRRDGGRARGEARRVRETDLLGRRVREGAVVVCRAAHGVEAREDVLALRVRPEHRRLLGVLGARAGDLRSEQRLLAAAALGRVAAARVEPARLELAR